MEEKKFKWKKKKDKFEGKTHLGLREKARRVRQMAKKGAVNESSV